MAGRPRIDLTGQVLGKLTVEEHIAGGFVRATCECGGAVVVQAYKLRGRGRVWCPECEKLVYNGGARRTFKRKQLTFTCHRCGRTASRDAVEVERSRRRGHNLYCGPQCSIGKPLSKGDIEGRRSSGKCYGGSMNAIAALARKREGYRYKRLEEALKGRKITFELPIGRYIFDLALHEEKLLVEFDEPFHQEDGWRFYDAQKDAAAERSGWRVVRLVTVPKTVIDPAEVLALL